jgi:hypothetical protein
VVIGILPFAAAGFLAWIMIRSMQTAPAAQNWTVLAVVIVGVALLLIARFVMRSSFFQYELESAAKKP